MSYRAHHMHATDAGPCAYRSRDFALAPPPAVPAHPGVDENFITSAIPSLAFFVPTTDPWSNQFRGTVLTRNQSRKEISQHLLCEPICGSILPNIPHMHPPRTLIAPSAVDGQHVTHLIESALGAAILHTPG